MINPYCARKYGFKMLYTHDQEENVLPFKEKQSDVFVIKVKSKNRSFIFNALENSMFEFKLIIAGISSSWTKHQFSYTRGISES